MLACDLLGQRQAQAGAFGATTDQRQEQVFGQFLGHATAVVSDFQAQRQGVQLFGDAHPVFNAGAQGDVAGAGLDGIAHQVPYRLGEAVGVAVEFGDAGVVIALQAHRPAGLVLGQTQHALQRGVDVQRRMRRGRRR
ncbi:hypothetical protein D3C72_1227840 [compost metagenome]